MFKDLEAKLAESGLKERPMFRKYMKHNQGFKKIHEA